MGCYKHCPKIYGRKQKRNEITYQNEQSHSIIAIEDDPFDNRCDYIEYGTIEIVLNIGHRAIQEEEEEEDEEEQNDYDNEDEEEEYDDDDDDDDEDDEDDDGDKMMIKEKDLILMNNK